MRLSVCFILLLMSSHLLSILLADEENIKYAELICYSASLGNNVDVQKALRLGASVDARDKKKGVTPLIWASSNGHLSTVKLLVKEGASLEKPDIQGMKTPLIAAAALGHLEVVNHLISSGANIEGMNGRGDTALQVAAYMGKTEVVQELIRRNAALNTASSKDGYTALHFASFAGNLEVVKALVGARAQSEVMELTERTPLMLAASEGCDAVVRYLLENGAGLHHQDQYGETALMLAIKGAHVSTVQILVDQGSDLELRNKEGDTPLLLLVSRTVRHTVMRDREQDKAFLILRMLVLGGADYEVTNANGESALELAMRIALGLEFGSGFKAARVGEDGVVTEEEKEVATALSLSNVYRFLSELTSADEQYFIVNF